MSLYEDIVRQYHFVVHNNLRKKFKTTQRIKKSQSLRAYLFPHAEFPVQGKSKRPAGKKGANKKCKKSKTTTENNSIGCDGQCKKLSLSR